MKFQLIQATRLEDKPITLFMPHFEEEPSSSNNKLIGKFLKDNPKFGKLFEMETFYGEEGQTILLGAGKREKFDFQKLQNWAGTAVKSSLKKYPEITLDLSRVEGFSDSNLIGAVVLGSQIATFDSSVMFKTEKEPVRLTEVKIVLDKVSNVHKSTLAQAQIVAEKINLVRELGDLPSNIMTPTYFLNTAKKLATANKLKITVIDEAQAKKKGMGAFVGVAQGSEEPSYIIALEYSGNPRQKDVWGIIGKGITFDSGGISLKPSGNMHEMKYDMMGAATVLATTVLASQLKLKVNVVGVMAVTENLPGGKAQRPGDIVKTYNGKTAEILNTDAEGRLVLSDAITLAQRDFKANKLIDLATLTGAMIISLGDFITGVFDNNHEFAHELIGAGGRVGEKFWEMPMDEEFDEMIKSDIADITNIGHGGSMPGAAGSITGAKFLAEFVEDNHPWVHLDIAGTAWDLKSKPYRGPGATGFALKTLIELLSQNQ